MEKLRAWSDCGGDVERIDVPTVVSKFPAEILHAPRSVAERLFDLRVWEQGTAGGHVAAWEQPGEFAGFLRAAVAPT